MSHLQRLEKEKYLRDRAFEDELKLKECILQIQKLNNEHSEFLDDLEKWLKQYK